MSFYEGLQEGCIHNHDLQQDSRKAARPQDQVSLELQKFASDATVSVGHN